MLHRDRDGRVLLGTLRLVLLITAAGFARAEDFELFEKKIRPIFTERCYECPAVRAKRSKANSCWTHERHCLRAARAVRPLFLANRRKVCSSKRCATRTRIGLAYREDRDRIDNASRLAIGRPATKEEIRLGIDYLEQCRQALKETAVAADSARAIGAGELCAGGLQQ